MPNLASRQPQGDTISILLSPRHHDDQKVLELDLAYRPRLAKSIDIWQSSRERTCFLQMPGKARIARVKEGFDEDSCRLRDLL